MWIPADSDKIQFYDPICLYTTFWPHADGKWCRRMSSDASSHTHWIWDVGKCRCGLWKAGQALSRAWGWAGAWEMLWDPFLAPMCCSSLPAKGFSQAGTFLNSVGPRGQGYFWAMDASSLAGWLCWDKEWKRMSSTVMGEGNGRNCPHYWWLSFAFGAGVEGDLRAYLPKKS